MSTTAIAVCLLDGKHMEFGGAGISGARRAKRGKRVSLPADIGRTARAFDLHALGAELGLLVEESTSPVPNAPPAFDRLPTELLTEIFLRCRVPGADAADTRQPPWTLSHVCARWRAAALACAALWQHVHVDALAYLALLPYYPTLLRAYLRRSAPLPLSLTLTQANGRIHPRARTEELCADHERALIDVLAVHAERWASADLSLTFGPEPLDRLRGRLARISRVRLSMYAPRSQITFLEDAPSLVTFATPQLACNNLVLPWDSLAHYDGPLRFNPIARNTESDPLAALTNLVTLALRFPYLPPSTFSPIVFPRLRALSIFSPACLARITAPKLEVLSLGGAGPAEIAAELLERSMSPNVRVLRLQCLALSAPCLARIAAAAPGVQELRITLKKWPMQPTCAELYAGLASATPPRLRVLAIPCTPHWFAGADARARPHPQAPAAHPSFDALLGAIQRQAPGLEAVQLLPDVHLAAMLDATMLIRPRLAGSSDPVASTLDARGDWNAATGAHARPHVAVSVVPSSSVQEVVHSWANVAGAVEGSALARSTDDRLAMAASGTTALFPGCKPRTVTTDVMFLSSLRT
ncbi:hypothetical protein HDZ31DRAFT_73483 [Schizophyllum fasciatum]